VLFHPDGKEVYSSGSDNKLHRWSIAEGKKAAETGLAGEAYKITPMGESLLTSAADNKVRQFNAKEHKQLREFTGAKDWVLATSYHADTKRVAGGAFNGQVYVWNTEDGNLITSFVAAPGYEPPKN
jgi:WD40 repeat protein